MKRLLVLTSHDFRGFANSRVHHLVAHFAPLFDETLVVFRPHSGPVSWRAFFRLGLRLERRGGLGLLEVSPWGARPHGVATRLLRLENPFERPPRPGKRLLQEAMAGLGAISDLLIVPSLLRALRGLGAFDLALAQGPFEQLTAAILRKRGRLKAFVCDDADYEPGFAPAAVRRRIIALAERRGMRAAELVVSVGRLLAARRRAEYGLPRVAVVPNGVDYGLFRRARRKRERGPVLLYMGFLGGWSGLDLLLSALVTLRAEGLEPPPLLLAGHEDPSYFAGWRKRAEEAGISFLHLGRFPYRELVKPLSLATIGWAAFPPVELRRYAFSLKVVEYMAGGLAVLATEGTESGGVVEEHRAGIVFPYRAEEAARAIEALTDRDTLSERMRNAARAAPRYDWRKILASYEELLRGHGLLPAA